MEPTSKRKMELFKINEALTEAEFLLFEEDGLGDALYHVEEALQEITAEIAKILNREQMEEV